MSEVGRRPFLAMLSAFVTVPVRASCGGAEAIEFIPEIPVMLDGKSAVGLVYATEKILSDSPKSFVALLAAGFGDDFPMSTYRPSEDYGPHDRTLAPLVCRCREMTAGPCVACQLAQVRTETDPEELPRRLE